jgi:hypothetical protein
MQANEQAKTIGEYFAFMLPADVSESEVAELRRQVRSGRVTAPHCYVKNILPTTGRSVLARLLSGDATYTGEVNYGALGSGATPVFTNASDKLVTEVFRKIPSSHSFDGHISYVDWFIAAADCADGTYTEWGAFIDGTASADSGQAWSLLATGGWVKSGSMYVAARYTIA